MGESETRGGSSVVERVVEDHSVGSSSLSRRTRKSKEVNMPGMSVTINFGDPVAAKHFFMWLDGAGEQSYWDWMEGVEYEEDGDITAVNFDYGSYVPDLDGEWVIKAKLGRLEAE